MHRRTCILSAEPESSSFVAIVSPDLRLGSAALATSVKQRKFWTAKGVRLTMNAWPPPPKQRIAKSMKQPTFTTLPGGHPNAVYGVTFTPDGKWVASCSLDHTVRFWDVATQEQKIFRDRHADAVTDLDFSADGTKLVTGGLDKIVKLWEPQSGGSLGVFTGADQYVSSVRFLGKSAKRFVSGSWDKQVGIWTESGLEATLSGHAAEIYDIDTTSDGDHIASCSIDGETRIWSVEKQASVHQLSMQEEGVHAVRFSPDDRLVATGGGDGSLVLWDVRAGHTVKRLSGHDGYVRALAFSPDGKWLATGARDGIILLHDLRTDEKTTLQGHRNTIYGLAFAPNSQLLASASFDRRVNLWKL